MANGPKPWEFQPGIDTNESWPCFAWYLRLAPPRKLTMMSGQFGVTVVTLRRWAENGLWSARAREYDSDLARQHKAEVDAIYARDGAEVAKQQLEMISMKNFIVNDQLEKLARRCLETDAPTMKTGDIIRLRREAFLEERLVRGQATAIVDGDIDWSQLSDEELDNVEKLMAKAKAKAKGAGNG